MSSKIREWLSRHKYLMLNAWGQRKNSVQVFSTAETLERLREQKCSLSRFGDGEFDLIFGNDLKFQKYDEKLANKLRKILLLEEGAGTCKVAIPRVFASLKGMTCASKAFWSVYLVDHREKIYGLLNPAYCYFDAQVTRIYVNRKNKSDAAKYFRQWKEVWRGEDILLVEGKNSRFGVGNDLFAEAKSVERILCPACNAFDYYDEILDTVTKKGINKLVLLVLGPTATALAYDLSCRGIWAIDSGNLDMEYEWSKIHAKKQVAIKGKYTHEADRGTHVSAVSDKSYEDQVMVRIGVLD